MRHHPAHCPDCHRLWLVATDGAPSASPACPRCHELGRLVPGAYYSDAASAVFERLEAAVAASSVKPFALGQLAARLEPLLPTPSEAELDAAFEDGMSGLAFALDPASGVGKRVALRMLVMIASTLSQPVVRESGVMRLPQTIPGLFDLIPKKQTRHEQESEPKPERDD